MFLPQTNNYLCFLIVATPTKLFSRILVATLAMISFTALGYYLRVATSNQNAASKYGMCTQLYVLSVVYNIDSNFLADSWLPSLEIPPPTYSLFAVVVNWSSKRMKNLMLSILGEVWRKVRA